MGFFSRRFHGSKSGSAASGGGTEASGHTSNQKFVQRVLTRVGEQAVRNAQMRQEASAAQAAADEEFFSRTTRLPPSLNVFEPHDFRKGRNSSDHGCGTANGPWGDRTPTTPRQGAYTSLSSELDPSDVRGAGLGPSQGRRNPPTSGTSNSGDGYPNDPYSRHSSRSALKTGRSLSIGDEGDGQGKQPSSDAQTGEGHTRAGGHGSEPRGRSPFAGERIGDHFGAESRNSSRNSSAHSNDNSSSSEGSQTDFVRGWGQNC